VIFGLVRHVLIDVINWNSELQERVLKALSECTVTCIYSYSDLEHISVYRCRSLIVIIYISNSRREGFIDLLGDEEDFTDKITSVLPRENIVIRFIERGV
jgi:hypothetical protein